MTRVPDSEFESSALPESAQVDEDESSLVHERSIGTLIREARRLNDAQMERIISHQREHGLRFGESAIALKLATRDDVLWALSQQFEYPYVPRARRLDNTELVAASDPFSDQAESFRELRSQLLMGVMADGATRSLAVLSPNVGDGKSFFAANIAIAFSQLGGRTLLLDVDMRTPRQHEIFKVENTYGLSSILAGRSDANVIHQAADLPSLFVMPVGNVPPNPLELVQRPSFSLLIHELSKKFDHVIVDTPAAQHGADARVVAAKCGASLVIGRRGKTKMAAINSLLAAIAKSPAKLAGVVLNDW